MARRKKNHYKMATHRKILRTVAGLLFKGSGVAAIAGPAIPPIHAAINKRSPDTLGEDLAWAYVGVGRTSWDSTQAFRGLGSVATGLFLFWLGRQVVRRI